MYQTIDWSKSMDEFMEYAKLYIISLEQDLEKNPESDNVLDIQAQLYAARHLLAVYGDILYNGEKKG